MLRSIVLVSGVPGLPSSIFKRKRYFQLLQSETAKSPPGREPYSALCRRWIYRGEKGSRPIGVACLASFTDPWAQYCLVSP